MLLSVLSKRRQMSPNLVGSLFSRAPMFGLHQSAVHATNQAFGIVGWVASQTHAILPLSLSQGSNREHLQLVQEFISVDIRLLSGAEVKLRIVSTIDPASEVMYSLAR